MTPVKCFRCKGKVRKTVNPETALISLGVWAVVDKLTWQRCSSCHGMGYVR